MTGKGLRLTELVAAAGCAAKMSPVDLKKVVGALAAADDPRLMVGPETLDDAAVIRLTDDLAICFTTDFITPLVDDPFDWGRIAATNAISDIYAMGGTPLVALNVVCWSNCLPPETLSRVMEGGAHAAREAGCIVGGGHSVQDKEPKYGMAVVGTVHPERVLRNRGARPGDILYLTKALGTGIACTAIKSGDVLPETRDAAVASMTTLNRDAALAAAAAGARALTDVTGFGLAGHLCEMLGDEDGLGVKIDAAALPILAGVPELIAGGIVPGGMGRNREAFSPRVDLEDSLDEMARTIVFDPQTSGGIVAAIPVDLSQRFEAEARRMGVSHWRIGCFDDSSRVRVVSEG